jgi:class 3 adenylate cyclase
VRQYANRLWAANRASRLAVGNTCVMGVEELIPETRFTMLGDDRIAYQVFGEGNVDLLWVGSTGDGIDTRWYWAPYASFLHRLATEARVIMFDMRGSGASDSPSGESLPGWERWADEARAVLDAVLSERAVLLGSLDGGPTAVLFAATHPARTRGLILANTRAHWGHTDPDVAKFLEETWGTEEMAEFGTPDSAKDPAFRRWLAMSERQSLSPRAYRRQLQLDRTMSVNDVLGSVRVPCLVLHRQGWEHNPAEESKYLADNIVGARFVSVPGNDGPLYAEPTAEILDHIETFVTGLQGVIEADRALAAILFTDIVGSTERASALGDSEWRNLLETHDAVARTVIDQHRGKLVKMTGDGTLSTFDGPGRAIRCALALRGALRPLHLEIRAGLHTGEVEIREADIAGIGVHIAARVLDHALPGELLVSAAVPMLVAGSGIAFEDRGEYQLKGISELWRLFAVTE